MHGNGEGLLEISCGVGLGHAPQDARPEGADGVHRQRARGAHLARALLCHDYMNREVIIPDGVDLTDTIIERLNASE